MLSRESSSFPRRRPSILATAIGSVPGLWGHAILRFHGVYRLESAGTRPVVLKVARVTGAVNAYSGKPHGPICVRPYFPTPAVGTLDMCDTDIFRRLNVRMYGHRHHVQQTEHQSGIVANPTRGQLNRENEYFPVPVHV